MLPHVLTQAPPPPPSNLEELPPMFSTPVENPIESGLPEEPSSRQVQVNHVEAFE